MHTRFFAGLTAVVGMGAALGAGLPAAAAPSYGEERLVARSDVDGDGRRDSVVQSTNWSDDGLSARVTLTVKGSSGRTSSVHLTAPTYPEFETPWVGVGSLDGKPGNDLAIYVSDDEVERYRVFTWRSGRLVSLAPPESRRGHRTTVWTGMQGEHPHGYRFYTSRGVRYVELLEGSGLRDVPRREFRATLTTYKWSKNSWVAVKTRHAVMPAYEKNVRPWTSFSGSGMKMW